MSVIDIVIPSYRGIVPEAHSSLVSMMQQSNCLCRDPRTGAPAHEPWKCTKGKHSVRWMPAQSGSVVHWSRNQAIAQAMHGQPKDGRPPADYFLLVDDDMVAKPNYLSRLASYKKDIVCGICTVRRDPPRPNIRFWNAQRHVFTDPFEWDWASQHLMEVDGAGAAFMLVKRTVFERMAKAYLDCEFELAEDRRKMATAPGDLGEYWQRKSFRRHEVMRQSMEEGNWSLMDCWWFQFLDNIVDDQIGELGEDISFCWKAKQLGYKIYADPQVLPGHIGPYAYGIEDYQEYVRQVKQAGEGPEPIENHVALEV